MAFNKVNIEFLRKQMDKVLEYIEKLKDKARDQHYKNGNGGWNFGRDCNSAVDDSQPGNQGTQNTTKHVDLSKR